MVKTYLIGHGPQYTVFLARKGKKYELIEEGTGAAGQYVCKLAEIVELSDSFKKILKRLPAEVIEYPQP